MNQTTTNKQEYISPINEDIISTGNKTTESISGDCLLSKTISFVRFPMAFLVAVIHGYFIKVVLDGGKTVIDFTDFLIYPKVIFVIGEITSIAVPVFYIISGFLFFYKIDVFNKKVYVSKLRKRISSLLVPYIIWNIFSTLFFMSGQHLMPSIFSGASANVSDYTWKEWLLIFWNDSQTGYPSSSQLWYLRDLMIVVLASPLIFVFIKHIKIVGIFILWILWFFDIEPDIVGLNATSFFLFSLGAYFSINRINFAILSEQLYRKGIGIIYIGVLIIALIYQNTIYTPFFHKLSITIGIFSLLGMATSYIRHGGRTSRLLANSTMFIYLSHLVPILFFKKLLISIIRPDNDFLALLVYFICPISVVGICLCLFWLMRKYAPRLTSVVTGGRV